MPSPEVPPLAETLDRFWDPGQVAGPVTVPAHPKATLVADAILRGLDPKLVEVRGRSLAEVLGAAYAVVAAEAERTRLRTRPA